MNHFELRNPVILKNQGQDIFGVLHLPVREPPFPAVLMCHGFGGNKVGRFRVYVTVAEELAKRGIASLRIDFRGSGDSQGSFEEMTIENEVNDALVALQWLDSHQDINSLRLGIFGRSLGGAVGLIAGHRFRNIQSLVTWAPVFSGLPWKNQWEQIQSLDIPNSEKLKLMQWDAQMAGPQFMKEFFSLHMGDVMSELSSIPFLHIHGEKDRLVDLTHANHYDQARKNSRVRTEMIRFPESDHEFTHLEERESAIQKTVDWFDETLKGE